MVCDVQGTSLADGGGGQTQTHGEGAKNQGSIYSPWHGDGVDLMLLDFGFWILDVAV